MWGINRVFQGTLAVLALIFWFAFSTPVLAREAVVTDIRVGAYGSATRVVFELTKQVPFSTFFLSGPDRVVIDLPEVGWRLPAQPLPSAKGVFQKLRYGLFKPGNSRIVLDIRQPAVVTQAFILKPDGGKGFRLVVELTPTSKVKFLGSVGKAPVKVTSAQPPPGPGSATPALAPPPAPAKPGPVAPARQKFFFAKGKDPQPLPAKPAATKPVRQQQQASPFRLAPRKPEPRHPGKKYVIMIDPGHGGVDPGTIGISGIYEKHLTLSMARELKKQFEKTGRFKAILTHDRDVFIRLRDRIQIARDNQADLFISIHADTVKNRRIKGPAVYTLSEKASDKEAAELAEKENKADLIAGVDLTHESPEVTNILIDLAQRESMNQSARFAGALIKELKRGTRVLRNTHRFAGFAVLKAPDVPSVLLEMGFLSNPEDERALRSRRYRSRLASSVVRAASLYFARVEEANRK